MFGVVVTHQQIIETPGGCLGQFPAPVHTLAVMMTIIFNSSIKDVGLADVINVQRSKHPNTRALKLNTWTLRTKGLESSLWL